MSNVNFKANVSVQLEAFDHEAFDPELERATDLEQLDAAVAEDIEAMVTKYFTNGGFANVTTKSTVSVKHELVPSEAAA